MKDITFFLDPDSATHLSGVREPTKVVLYNTETDKLLYFGSMKQVVEMIEVSRAYIYNAYKNNWFIKGKYKAVHIENVPRYNNKTGYGRKII